MKLLQLQYFMTVCKYLNITRAAEELYVSQPAISTSIRELERELGVQLFLRHNNRLFLTQEGQLLQKQAGHILKEVARLKKALSDKAALQSDIYLGLPPTLYAYFFPFLLQIKRQIAEHYPSVKLHIHDVPIPQIEKNLHDGTLDFAIVHVDEQSYPRMEKETFYSAQVKLCMRRDHPLAAYESVSVDDFYEKRILTCFKEDAVVNRTIDTWYTEQSRRPTPRSAYQQSQALEALLLLSADVALLCPEVCMFSSQIVGIPLQKPLKLNFGVVWNGERLVSNAMLDVIEQVRSFADWLSKR